MAESLNKYTQKPYYVTQKGISDILNVGQQADSEDKSITSRPGGYFQIAGASSDEVPVIQDDSDLPVSIAAGLTTEQAVNEAYTKGFKNEADLINRVSAADPIKWQDYYNKSGLLPRLAGDSVAIVSKASEATGDFVLNDILGGRVYRSADNSIREDSWARAVVSANESGNEAYKNFAENMYIKTTDVEETDGKRTEITSYTKLSDLKSASEFSMLDPDKLVINTPDGKSRPANAEEKEWAIKYRNLNRSRVADENATVVANAFGEQYADGITWYDEWLDSRGDKYTKDRLYSQVIGAAVGSALPYELVGVGPFAMVNAAGRVVKARSVVKAIATADKMWRGSRLTNPYLLSQGAGIYARGTSVAANFLGSYAQQYVDTRAEAIAAGWDNLTANRIAGLAATGEAILETAEYQTFMHRLLMGGKSWGRFLFQGAPAEGTEEVLQGLWENKVKKDYGLDYLTYKEIGADLWMRFVGGFSGALGIGAVHNFTNVTATLATGDFKKAKELANQERKQLTEDWLKSSEDVYANAEGVNATQETQPSTEEGQKLKPVNIEDVKKKAGALSSLRNQLNTAFTAMAKTLDEKSMGALNTDLEEFQKYCDDNGVDINDEQMFAYALYEFYGLEQNLPEGVDYFTMLPVQTQAAMASAAAALKAQGISPKLTKEEAQSNREATLLQAKAEYVRKVKMANPSATNEEIDAGWAHLSNRLTADMNSGDLTEALASEAEENFAILKNSKMAQAQIKQSVFGQIKKISGRLNTDSIRAALTVDSANQYDAQWQVAQDMIARRVEKATGNPKLGKAMAALVKRIYYQDLRATPEVTPIQFVSMTFPNIVSASKLRRNGLYVEGISGLGASIQQFDSVDDETNFGYNKKTAEILVDLVDQYNQTNKSEEKEQIAQQIMYGLFGKAAEDMDPQAIVSFLQGVFNEEAQIASISAVMGLKVLSPKDVKTMAIMRLKGMSQKGILTSFGIGQNLSEDKVNSDYEYSVNQIFGTVSNEELATLQELGARVVEQENSGTEVKGVYSTDEQGVATIALREGASPEVVTEEVIHWITDTAEKIASFSDSAPLVALGALQDGIYAPKGDSDALYTNPRIRDFYYRVRDLIQKRFGNKEITKEQIHETAAELIMRALVDPNVDPELAALFNDILPVRKASEGSEGSLYRELTNHDKAQFKSLLKEQLAAKELTRANERLREADALNKQILEARKAIDHGKPESAAYQLYKNLTGYLASRPKTFGELNKGLAKMIKIYGEAKRTGKDYSGALISQAISTIQELQKRAYTGLLNSLFADDKTDWVGDLLSEGKEPDLSSVVTSPASTAGDSSRVVLFSSKKKGDFRTLTQKMRNYPTDLRRFVNEMKYFSPKSVAGAFKQLTNSVVDIAKEYHPMFSDIINKAALELSTMKQYNATLNYRWLQVFDDYNEKAAKEGREAISKVEFLKYRTYLANHQRKNAFALMEKRMADDPKAQAMLHDIHVRLANALDFARTQMIAMGYDVSESVDYFPAPVEDMEAYAMAVYQEFLQRDADPNDKFKMPAYLKVLAGQPNTSLGKQIIAEIKKLEGKKGKVDENTLMMMNAINEALANPHDRSESHHLYQTKNLNKTMDDVRKFYKDPFDAFQAYMDDVAEKVFDYRLVGKVKKTNLDKMGGQIGAAMYQARMGKLAGFVYNAEKEKQFIIALRHMLGRHAPEQGFLTEMKKLQSIATLGRLASAINQYLELGPIMYRYGFINGLSAMVEAVKGVDKSQWAISLDNIGIQALNEAERNDSESFLADINTWLLSANFFTKSDILMKNTAMIAAMMHAQESINAIENGETGLSLDRFNKYFDNTFSPQVYNEQQRAKIKQDLKDGKITKETRLFLRDALAMTQPIDLTEIPAAYNDMGPFGRNMYFLSTVTIKQMKFLFGDTLAGFTKHPVKSSMELCRLAFFCALVGIPADWIKDILRGRQPNIKESVMYSPMAFTIFNKFYFAEAKRRGLIRATGDRFFPGLTLVDDFWKAMVNLKPAELVRSVPYLEVYYNFFGPGHENSRRHREALNTKDSLLENLITKQMTRKNVKFFGWKF